MIYFPTLSQWHHCRWLPSSSPFLSLLSLFYVAKSWFEGMWSVNAHFSAILETLDVYAMHKCCSRFDCCSLSCFLFPHTHQSSMWWRWVSRTYMLCGIWLIRLAHFTPVIQTFCSIWCSIHADSCWSCCVFFCSCLIVVRFFHFVFSLV